MYSKYISLKKKPSLSVYVNPKHRNTLLSLLSTIFIWWSPSWKMFPLLKLLSMKNKRSVLSYQRVLSSLSLSLGSSPDAKTFWRNLHLRFYVLNPRHVLTILRNQIIECYTRASSSLHRLAGRQQQRGGNTLLWLLPESALLQVLKPDHDQHHHRSSQNK